MKKIKILGVCGSPRKGATEFAVRYALRYLEENYGITTDFFTVRGKNINFCVHCDFCVRKKKGCIHQDDMQGLYSKLVESQAWILASPTYHGHISAQLKAVLDRTRALVAVEKNIFANKLGVGIAVGGDRNGGQEQVLHTLIDFYLINEMLPVSGGVFGANLGGVLWSQDKGGPGAEGDAQGLISVKKTLKRLMNVSNIIF